MDDLTVAPYFSAYFFDEGGVLPAHPEELFRNISRGEGAVLNSADFIIGTTRFAHAFALLNCLCLMPDRFVDNASAAGDCGIFSFCVWCQPRWNRAVLRHCPGPSKQQFREHRENLHGWPDVRLGREGTSRPLTVLCCNACGMYVSTGMLQCWIRLAFLEGVLHCINSCAWVVRCNAWHVRFRLNASQLNTLLRYVFFCSFVFELQKV